MLGHLLSTQSHSLPLFKKLSLTSCPCWPSTHEYAATACSQAATMTAEATVLGTGPEPCQVLSPSLKLLFYFLNRFFWTFYSYLPVLKECVSVEGRSQAQGSQFPPPSSCGSW